MLLPDLQKGFLGKVGCQFSITATIIEIIPHGTEMLVEQCFELIPGQLGVFSMVGQIYEITRSVNDEDKSYTLRR
jgi:hypothetical protein